jgi:TolA-binding protein
MTIASLLTYLALTTTAAVAGQASDSVEGPVPEEVDAFRKARERFKDRMTELDGDTRRYVDFREGEERSKLTGSYDALIASLEEDERGHRLLAMERFERFLERYPDASYASHVRFRLADLYFEQATEDWLAQFEAFEEVMNDPDASLEDLERMEEQGEPKRDLGPSIALYERIIADNIDKPADERYERLDGTFVMLGFCYQDANAIQYDPQKAREAFATLIDTLPESELADRSHLFLGNYLFADGEFDAAMAEYEAVANRGDDSKYYMEALYQLAWARYKLDDFDGALTLFTELLDKSEKQKLQKGRESSYAPDARRFMAFSFADLSYENADAVAVADGYFAQIGDRDYRRDVYIELADVLIRYTRPEEAIEVYERLQASPWENEPDNPEHQIQVVSLYAAPLIRDLEKTGAERLEFIERYTEGTPWWEANRNDPEALEVARSYIESSLLEVAIEYRVRAQETGEPADFAVAAQKYQEYLDKFPISDDYYEQQWTMADSLKKAGDLDAARDEYASLVRSSRYHPYGDGALYSLMDVALRQLQGPPGEPPADGVVERSYEANDGKTVEVYELSPDRVAFIEAADAVLDHEFGPPGNDQLPDFQTLMAEKGASILYITGQIPYYHNRFEEARPRLERVVEEYRTSIEASYAAGLLVDSYLAEGDYEKVRYYTKTFSQNPPGPPTEIDPERFKGTLEGTTFKLALDQAGSGDYLGAADAFVAFRQEFPDSQQFAADALYNAAYYSQQGGKAGRSSELYEQFVREYPNDERSKDLFFRIAGNYEQVFELDKAVDNYRAVLTHPDATEKEKADAQFNASFLLIGLKRHQEAAEGFEAYEARYDAEDEEDVYWLAGEQWEEVSTSRAIKFYEDYLRKFPDTTPDHVIEAHYRLARLYEEQGDSRKAERAREGILDAFNRFATEGKKIGANGHRYAAEADFPRLQEAFAEYSADELTGNQDTDTPLLTEDKPAELKEVEAQIKQFVGRYSNFEYNSGALLLQARAALYLADLGLSIQCPAGFSEEECWAFEDLLQESVFPQYYEIEEVGIQRLQDLVTAARDQKRHSRFIDEALVELNRRRPSDFPAVKEELEGGTDSTIPASIEPVRLEASADDAEEQP